MVVTIRGVGVAGILVHGQTAVDAMGFRWQMLLNKGQKIGYQQQGIVVDLGNVVKY
jgi:hypothetical protein